MLLGTCKLKQWGTTAHILDGLKSTRATTSHIGESVEKEEVSFSKIKI